MSKTVNEIEMQMHSSFSVHFEVLTKSVINGALEQCYLKLLADPAYFFIAPENMRNLLRIVVSDVDLLRLDDPRPVEVAKWVNQTTGRIMDVVPLPGLDQYTIVFGFIEY